MLCESVVDSRPDWADQGDDPAALDRWPDLDWLDLQWHACRRRAFAGQTRRGLTVRVLLPVGVTLRHGSVLGSKPPSLVVRIEPCRVLSVRWRSASEGALAALELGNLHVPVEIERDRLLTLDDGPVRGVLDKHSIAYEVATERFQPQTIWGLSWKIADGDGKLTIVAPGRATQTRDTSS